MNGVTGRMGLNQHLRRSIYAIIAARRRARLRKRSIMPRRCWWGATQSSWMPSPRSAAACHGPRISIRRWPTRPTRSTSTPKPPTGAPSAVRAGDRRRQARLLRKADGGVARCGARSLPARRTRRSQTRRGAGQALAARPAESWSSLKRQGFFGRILSRARRIRLLGVRGRHTCRRSGLPGTTARKMAAASFSTCCAIGATCSTTSSAKSRRFPALAPPTFRTRWDEAGQPYAVTADDSAYATFELAGGIVAHFNSSWCVRVRRDDLLTFQVDGTKGTAVAGLRHCWIQPYGATPRPIWNPDIEQPARFLRWLAESARTGQLRQRLQAPVGIVPAPRGQRRALPLGPAGRRQRRPVCRTRPGILAQARLGGCAGAGGGIGESWDGRGLQIGSGTLPQHSGFIFRHYFLTVVAGLSSTTSPNLIVDLPSYRL